MKVDWICWIPWDYQSSLGHLRLVPDIQVHPEQEGVWVAGPFLPEKFQPLLDALPAPRRYSLDDQQRMTRLGKRVPTRDLPNGEWFPLGDWLQPDFDLPRSPAMPNAFASWTLVPTSEEQRANLLITSPSQWCEWAIHAPEIRLTPLRYALSEDQCLAVHGKPLPPLRGCHYVLEDQIAIEAGYALDPPLDRAVLKKTLGAEEQDTVLLHGDREVELIHSHEWFAASRSSARRLST